MARGGKLRGKGRRFSAPAVLVLMVLGVAGIGALAAVLLSGDSDGEAPQELVSVPTIEGPDATESTAATEGAPTANKSKPQLPPAVRKVQADAARAAAIAAAPPTADQVCPPKASPRQCAELLKILRDARQASDPIERGECPLATKAQCEEAARIYKEAKGTGNPIDFEGGECPFSDQAMCEEAGRQAQQQQGG